MKISPALTIRSLSEFKHFDPQTAENWTLPMVAAWFIWRDHAAVRDQWEIAMELRRPISDPPIFLLEHSGFIAGTLKSIFSQAGYDEDRWANPKTGPFDEIIADNETESPWERLKYALQHGKLAALDVHRGIKRNSIERHRQYKDDWGPCGVTRRGPEEFRGWSGDELILISREKAIEAERAISRLEYRRPIMGLKQAVGWVAYRSEERFRSLSRADMAPLGYFDRKYEPSYLNERPDEELFAYIVAGKIKGYIKGSAEALALPTLTTMKSIWDVSDVVFSREDIVNIWPSEFCKNPEQKSQAIAEENGETPLRSSGRDPVPSASTRPQSGKRTGPRPKKLTAAVEILRSWIEKKTGGLEALEDMKQEALAALCNVKSRETALKALEIVKNADSDK